MYLPSSLSTATGADCSVSKFNWRPRICFYAGGREQQIPRRYAFRNDNESWALIGQKSIDNLS